jgi:hypothetical protein
MQAVNVMKFERALWDGDIETCVQMLEKDSAAVRRYTNYYGEEFGSLEAMCAQMATENCKELREILCPSFYR